MNDKILDTNYQFGKRITFLRNIRKISQEELAFRCELNTKYYSDIERGRRNPTLKVLEKIALGLGISLEELFKSIDAQYDSMCKNRRPEEILLD